MKFKTILAILLIAFATAGMQAEKKGKSMAMHNKVHSELANAKTGLDKSTLNNMIKADLEKRENAASEKSLSGESSAMLNDLLKEAHRHLGKPYRSGSKGPNAFDCSGFSSYVYRQFGYTISPSSRAQYLEGEKVDRNHLRKGDLVFFTSRRSGKNVGHVGIVVSADNATGQFQFIHAARTGIKVDKCEGYYAGRYIGARRIITD